MRMKLPMWRADPKPLPEIVAALGAAEDGCARRGGTSIVMGWWWSTTRRIRCARSSPISARLAREGDVLTIVTAPGSDPGSGAGAGTDIISRAFAPGAGIDEDPVTGSAHAVLVPYWSRAAGARHDSPPIRPARAAAD